MKKDLKLLKDSHASLDEIRYVSRLLRSKLAKKTSTITSCETLDHDLSISKHFWGYVKLFLQKKPSLLPSFLLERCKQFFIETLSAKHPNKQFPIPSWIPSFSNPTHPFHSDTPPYQKITSIVRRMKSFSSPCPIDKISVVCFKHCLHLRSFSTYLIRFIWLSGHLFALSGYQSLHYINTQKRGTEDPSNFRPITLQSVPLKIFTSCLRDSVFDFLKQNGFIEHQIQKGFPTRYRHIIDKARIKQRSLVITLLDLKLPSERFITI